MRFLTAFPDRFAAVSGGATAWQQIYLEKPLEISHFCSWIFLLLRSQELPGRYRAPTAQVEVIFKNALTLCAHYLDALEIKKVTKQTMLFAVKTIIRL